MTGRRSLFVGAIGAALLLPLMEGCSTSSGGQSSAARYVDDAGITTRVKAALVEDPIVKAREVNVETSGGVVQLSGFVDSDAAVKRAGEVARQVSGVQSVKNDIRLKPR